MQNIISWLVVARELVAFSSLLFTKAPLILNASNTVTEHVHLQKIDLLVFIKSDDFG